MKLFGTKHIHGIICLKYTKFRATHFCFSLTRPVTVSRIHALAGHLLARAAYGVDRGFPQLWLSSVSASAWFTTGKAIRAGRLRATSCLPRWPEIMGCFPGLPVAANISRNSLGKTGDSQGAVASFAVVTRNSVRSVWKQIVEIPVDRSVNRKVGRFLWWGWWWWHCCCWKNEPKPTLSWILSTHCCLQSS